MRIVSAFGPPCSLSSWGVGFLKNVLECAGEAVEFVYKSDVDGLVEAWRSSSDKACLIYADLPDDHVIDLYARTKAPIVVFREAPLDLVSYLMRERAIPLRDAIATATLFLSTYQKFEFRDRMLVVTRKPRSVRGLTEEILNLFSSDLPPETRAETLNRVLETYGGPASVDELVCRYGAYGEPSGALGDRLPSEEKDFVERVLTGYITDADGGEDNGISWPRELFLLADDPGRHLSGRIEMVGNARFLIYGPYLCLPFGEWIATVELEIEDNASGNILFVDICGGAEPRLVQFRLPVAGRFSFSMPVRVSDPRKPIELRAALGEGAIEGRIDWRGVYFAREIDGVQRELSAKGLIGSAADDQQGEATELG